MRFQREHFEVSRAHCDQKSRCSDNLGVILGYIPDATTPLIFFLIERRHLNYSITRLLVTYAMHKRRPVIFAEINE